VKATTGNTTEEAIVESNDKKPAHKKVHVAKKEEKPAPKKGAGRKKEEQEDNMAEDFLRRKRIPNSPKQRRLKRSFLPITALRKKRLLNLQKFILNVATRLSILSLME
jgi:hypothetical protein